MTVQRWIQLATARLQESGIEAASLESQLLACHALSVDRPWLFAHAEESFPEAEGEALLVRRMRNEPLAYVLGWREFYGRKFGVAPGVLIPRQETEILVEAAIEKLGAFDVSSPRVLDLGTGSGCIALSIKLEFPNALVVGSDISSAALVIAEHNKQRLHADVRFIQSDGFAAFDGEPFNVIVTNPPYIGLSEFLPKEVFAFEPPEALYGGPTGLEFYERLAIEAAAYLAPRGLILMEVGYLQAEAVTSVFVKKGWIHVETRRDLSGIDRTVVCERAKTASDDS